MRLLARAAKFYGWSHRDMMTMPWRSFLGYVREADIMTQEDNDAYHDAVQRGRGGVVDSNSYSASEEASVIRSVSFG